jgi:hypothetical protein
LKALADDLGCYAEFCARCGVTGIPACVSTVLAYLRSCHAETLTSTAIARRLAAVALAHGLLSRRPSERHRALVALPPILRSFVSGSIPSRLSDLWAEWNNKICAAEDLRSVFSKIYIDKIWGDRVGDDYYSGSGSHNDMIVNPYVEALREFASGLPGAASAVDLGCGDFNVGRRICNLFSTYTACDIVPALINRNIAKFDGLGVRFVELDITNEPLPPGDVVFIRQVLQHLSNDAIASVLSKLDKYRHVLITEAVPITDRFEKNIDKPSGANVRTDFESGVVVTDSPFSLRPLRMRVLCEVREENRLIQTIAYEFG